MIQRNIPILSSLPYRKLNRYINRACFLLLIFSISFSTTIKIFAADSTEAQIKAALLYKLTHFIDWPNFQERSSFNLCILGENNFKQALDFLKTRSIKNQSTQIYYFKNSQSIHNNCQLVFISQSKKYFLKDILKKFKNRPILTISDIENFAQNGGIIELSTIQKKISFKINLGQAQQSKLRIASPLLEMSTIIQETKR